MLAQCDAPRQKMTAQAEVPDPSSFAGTKPALRQHLEGVCHTMSYLMDPNDTEAPAKLGLSAQTYLETTKPPYQVALSHLSDFLHRMRSSQTVRFHCLGASVPPASSCCSEALTGVASTPP